MSKAVAIQEQLEALQQQAATLKQQLDELKQQEIGEVVERMKKEIAAYGITAQMLGFKMPGRKANPNSLRNLKKGTAASAVARSGASGEAASPNINAAGAAQPEGEKNHEQQA